MKKERYTYKGITIEAVPKGRCRDCYLESKITNGKCDATKAEQFKAKDCVMDRKEGEHIHFKLVKSHKLSDKELMKRKFRKFLYNNDVLELWYKNVKNSRWNHTSRQLFTTLLPGYWISNAFPWPHEEYRMWRNLYDKWDFTINKPT